MSKFLGNLPDNITIVCRDPIEISWKFDDLLGEDGEAITKVTVTPAFVSDSANEKTLTTARQWASRRYYGDKGDGREPTEISRKNEPFRNLQIVNLEVRAEGGRAWKVITEDGLYFDLREDVLLEAMHACGVGKYAVLKGEYVWGKVGTQMKIVRVGSDLYKWLIEATKRGELKKLASKNLEVGKIYETKGGKKYAFMGWVRTMQFGHTNIRQDDGRWAEVYSKYSVPKTGLFFEIRDWYMERNPDSPDAGLAEILNEDHPTYYFSLKKDPNFILESGSIPVPDNVIQVVKEKATEAAFTRQGNHGAEQLAKWAVDKSGLINMVPLGEEVVIHPNFSRLKLK